MPVPAFFKVVWSFVLAFLFASDVRTRLSCYFVLFCYREQYDKLKDDVMMQDEERTLILEKEKGNVRTFLFVCCNNIFGCSLNYCFGFCLNNN